MATLRKGVVLAGLASAVLWPALLRADVYEVQPGDSLSAIAERFGVAQDVIQSLNPDLPSSDLLYVGQRLLLPNDVIPSTNPARVEHTVQPGETLGGIANLYGVPEDDILTLNPGLARDLLFAGTTIVIHDDLAPPPASTTSPEPASATLVPYLVQPGDTYSGIAARFGLTLDALYALNPGSAATVLFADGVIFVPVGDGATPDSPPLATPTGSTTSLTDYTIMLGDSASAIANKFGYTLAQLQAANPGIDLSVVYVGQTIRLPDDSVSAATPDDRPLTLYGVLPGDTASELADRFDLTLAGLQALNPSISLDILYVGQALVVPKVDLPPPPPGTVAAAAPGPLEYQVRPGDTLSAIAAAVGATVDTLMALNPGLDPNLLSVGQPLRVPGNEPIPVVSTVVFTEYTDTLEYVAARLGILPHTLLANNPGIEPNGVIAAGTPIVMPDREGLLVKVQSGDTLLDLALRHGSSIDALLNDPRNGVTDPNHLIIGQEVLIPILLPDLIWPTSGQLTDGFGVCRTVDCSSRHHGIDISQHATPGGSILSVADGTVSFAGGTYCCGFGFYVEIEHADGLLSRYAHLVGPPPVVVGQQVAQGAVIGYSGSTGWSTGVHLHLELEHNGWLLNALNYLP